MNRSAVRHFRRLFADNEVPTGLLGSLAPRRPQGRKSVAAMPPVVAPVSRRDDGLSCPRCSGDDLLPNPGIRRGDDEGFICACCGFAFIRHPELQTKVTGPAALMAGLVPRKKTAAGRSQPGAGRGSGQWLASRGGRPSDGPSFVVG